eukprot:3443532-Pleurochrysis_carterae.AAC.1
MLKRQKSSINAMRAIRLGFDTKRGAQNKECSQETCTANKSEHTKRPAYEHKSKTANATRLCKWAQYPNIEDALEQVPRQRDVVDGVLVELAAAHAEHSVGLRLVDGDAVVGLQEAALLLFRLACVALEQQVTWPNAYARRKTAAAGRAGADTNEGGEHSRGRHGAKREKKQMNTHN